MTRNIRRVPASPAAVPPSRRRPGVDACPGTLHLHHAADGWLARIRCPGGLLTAEQLSVLGGAARALGDGRLELTSRANVQIRGLPAGAAGDLSARLAPVGLLPSASHERVRNILGSPLGVVDGAARWDVAGQVRALDAALCAVPALAGLSGRFLFAVDDGRGDVAARGPDIALLPQPHGPVAVLLGGGDHGIRAAPDQSVTVAIAIAAAFLAESAGTDAWRLTDLPDGPARIAARIAAHPYVRRVAERITGPAPARPPIGPVRRPDGGIGLALAVPLGRIDPDQTSLLVRAAGAGGIRLAPWRGLVLPELAGGPCGRPTDWPTALAAAGLVTDPASSWLGVSACAGRPGCARSQADVRADATAAHGPTVGGPTVGAGSGGGITAGGVTVPPGAALPVHWLGCERGCGSPTGRFVQVLATATGYQVRAPGRAAVTVAPGSALAATIRTARRDP